MTDAIGNEELEHREEGRIPEERRCTFVWPEGQQCKQRRWRGKELCYQHHPDAAELRKNAGRRALSAIKVLTATEVHQMLAEALEAVRDGEMPPGQAYAVGYLGQLLLGNLESVYEEYDWVKTRWDRYHHELYNRVRRLDEGRGLAAEEGKEAEESVEEPLANVRQTAEREELDSSLPRLLSRPVRSKGPGKAV
jgi:hypothetical protein